MPLAKFRGLLTIAKVVVELGGSDNRGLERVENNLRYPDSQYENLRHGFPSE